MLLLEELVAVFTALFDAVSVTSIQPCAYREKAYSLKFTMPYKSLNPMRPIVQPIVHYANQDAKKNHPRRS